MIANPLSDSGSAISIYKMFNSIDVLSRDVVIHFPGFYQYDNSNSNGANVISIKNDFIDSNKINYADYHRRSPVFYTYCNSVGHIYFNEAEFAKFIYDLEAQTAKFEYDGNAQLVLIPSCEGEMLYDKIQSYNLEALYDYQTKLGQKLETFLVSVFKLLQKDSQRHSINLIKKIDDIYNAKLECDKIIAFPNTITIHLDDRILEYMKWRKSDEVFFISYSTKDEYYAYALKALLEKCKRQVWIAPDGIPDSSDYACAIPAALRISSRVIVLLSHNSANSVWVRREVAKAVSNNKKIDGILLGDFSMEDLKEYDHFDFLFEGIQVKHTFTDLFDDKETLHNWLQNN